MYMSITISLTQLKTQCKLSEEIPLTSEKTNYIYPISEELLKKHYDDKIVNEYLNLYNENLKINNGLVFNESLRQYQNEGIQRIIKHDVFGIFDQQRLGKTPTTLVAIRYKPIEKSIMIIAPKSTLVNWEQECENG